MATATQPAAATEQQPNEQQQEQQAPETAKQIATIGPGNTAFVPARVTKLLRPIAQPVEVIAAQNETRALIAQALVKDRDYGVIQGTKTPTLLKPGAEKVVLAFGCYARFRIVESEVDHHVAVKWTKTKRVYNNAHKGDRSFNEVQVDGESIGIYRYTVECEIVNRATDEVVGQFYGSCSSLESKYIDRPRDVENTVLKIAEKRALVGAALTTFGLSDQFTQDVEDLPREIVGKSANEASAVQSSGGEPSEQGDFVIPYGDFKGQSVRQTKPDGEYLVSVKNLARMAQWCLAKINEAKTDGDPAKVRKFTDWRDGFEGEIERRAVEDENAGTENGAAEGAAAELQTAATAGA
jgi:hypothetical protein